MLRERIGEWIIEAEIGRDPHGMSFRPSDGQTKAVIRLLQGTLCQSAEFHSVFKGRLKVLRRLAHSSICPYLGGGIVHGEPYYVSPVPEGRNYQALLQEGRPLWPIVLAHGVQLASALHYAHRQGVLHGAVNPANTYYDGHQKITLTETGIAKLFDVIVPTANDGILSAAAFLAPEQLAGKEASKRSDFYSLGCLLYTLLCGRPPFVASTGVELIHKQCFTIPERPSRLIADLPEEFDSLIMRLLEKDPQSRPGSGTVLVAELDRIWSALGSRTHLSLRALTTESGIPERPRIAIMEPKPVAVMRPYRPMMNRPLVVIPAFLIFCSVAFGAYYLSQESAESLYSQAEPLMRSNDPNDWERAWHDYLEPLSRKYPDRYVSEIRTFRGRVEPLAELRRALATGRLVKFQSEAERFYQLGVQLCQAGDFAAAVQVWERVVAAFAKIENESAWVELSKQAISRVTPNLGALHRTNAASVRTSLKVAADLKAAGKLSEAKAIWDALELLYRDDADAIEIFALIRKERAP